MLLFVAQRSTSDKQTMTSMQLYTAEKATMVSLKKTYNSPEKCRLRKLLKYQKEEYTKKVRNLQQIARRRKDQLSTLKDVLNSLRQKRLLETEQSEILLSLGGSNDELFKRLRKKQMHERVPRQY